MSSLTVTLPPSATNTSPVQTDSYAVATVAGVMQRGGSPSRQNNGRAMQSGTRPAARQGESATVPQNTGRGTLRNIVV